MRLGYFQVNVQIFTIGLDQLDRSKMPITKALHKIDYYPWIEYLDESYTIGYRILSRSKIECSECLLNVGGSDLDP